ncbi:hypothetical protein [Vibrio anguillarum]|uniref:hypothetical protein n=1 Tax=Vibrio anguillarum TaxID=55601 RepID=UPI0039C2AE4C
MSGLAITDDRSEATILLAARWRQSIWTIFRNWNGCTEYAASTLMSPQLRQIIMSSPTLKASSPANY